jgi:hypothetical protein
MESIRGLRPAPGRGEIRPHPPLEATYGAGFWLDARTSHKPEPLPDDGDAGLKARREWITPLVNALPDAGAV